MSLHMHRERITNIIHLLYPMRIILYFLAFITLTGYAQTDQDTLIVLANQKLYKVNRNNAGANFYLNVINPPAFDPVSLDWSEPLNCYFGIEHAIGNTIFKISESGVYTSLGVVNVPGFNVYIIEGIAFNPQDNALYASVSLDGGPSQNDYTSESLIKINLATMQGQYVNTFNHPPTVSSDPEADAIEFDELGMLYYFDCSTNSDNRIFKQDLAFTNPPTLLNQTLYWPLSDLTVKDGQVYAVTSTAGTYSLQNCSVNGGTLQQTAIAPSPLFNGASLRGITWKPSCAQMPTANFSALGVTTGYPGLTVNFSNSSQHSNTFEFQFGPGATTTTNDISEIVSYTFTLPGVYPVLLTASNGSCSDTSIIYVTILAETGPAPVVPNTFTPDEDGVNDLFFLTFPGAVEIKVEILNRWGNQLVELKGLNAKWDGTVNGKPVSEGVYFYTYDVTLASGKQVSGHGFVTLVK